MSRPELFQKLDTLLDEAQQSKGYGTVEIELRAGKPVLLRTVKTEKIEDKGIQNHVNGYR